MSDEEAAALLERFVGDVRRALPLVAVWVHGSLAAGDFQLGRSDFDLVAIIAEEMDSGQRRELERLHRRLIKDFPVARKLHCSYVERRLLRDPGEEHDTWAFEELFRRPISPVNRRELLVDGVALYGPEPAGMVPPVTEDELTTFISDELDTYWRRVAGRSRPWLRDAWVDSGLLTLARATVTLRGGGMISKREALAVLIQLGAPADVVRDIHDRRYGRRTRRSPLWKVRRAGLARTFMREGIDRALIG
ncbi:nucleotidyltransferase [Streptosporangium sp. KLBMP 9127]|nr:nucleotidyltransferase [Streptosporangium sp. KLBMP 9127]